MVKISQYFNDDISFDQFIKTCFIKFVFSNSLFINFYKYSTYLMNIDYVPDEIDYYSNTDSDNLQFYDEITYNDNNNKKNFINFINHLKTIKCNYYLNLYGDISKITIIEVDYDLSELFTYRKYIIKKYLSIKNSYILVNKLNKHHYIDYRLIDETDIPEPVLFFLKLNCKKYFNYDKHENFIEHLLSK